MKRFVPFILTACMALAALTGCDTESNTGTTPPVESGTEKTGIPDEKQVYNTYIGSEPMSLDIGRSSDTYGGGIINNTYEMLTRSMLVDDNIIISPAGAESWSVNEEGTVWTFKLRENNWSDGVPVTAHDYEYGIKRVVDPETGAPLAFMLDFLLNFSECNSGELDIDELGVRAIDDYTLEIELSAPSPYFMNLTYNRVMAPQRKDLVEKYGDKFGSDAEYTASCGPYVVSSWVHNSKIELTKNEHYWNKDNVILEKVDIAIIADETTVLNSYDAGEIDYVSTAKPEFVEKFQAKGNADYVSYPSATLTYSFFNTQDELFSNVNIRKAFILGIDREEINDMCFYGMRIPTYGWVVPSISVGEQNYREAAGDLILDMAENNPSPKELLLKGMEELGLGDDPSTLKVTFSLAGTDTWFRNLGEYLQQAYKESLGINLEISFTEWSIFINNVEKGEYQIGFMGWGASFNEPYDVLSLHTSTSNAIYTGWSNEKYDELIAKASVELDDEKRLQLYIEAEKLLIEEYAVANPLACSLVSEFYRDYVDGTRGRTFVTTGYQALFMSGKE